MRAISSSFFTAHPASSTHRGTSMSCSLLSLPVPAQGGRQADEVSQRPFIEYLLCPVPSRHRDTQVRLSIDGNVGRNLLPDLQMAIRPQEQAKGGGERYAVGDNLSSRSEVSGRCCQLPPGAGQGKAKQVSIYLWESIPDCRKNQQVLWEKQGHEVVRTE